MIEENIDIMRDLEVGEGGGAGSEIGISLF